MNKIATIPASLQVLDISSASPYTFSGNKVLGQVMLLPSQKRDEVALRYKKSNYDITLSIVCRLKQQTRKINIADQELIYDARKNNDFTVIKKNQTIIDISTPELLLSADFIFSHNRFISSRGYFYRGGENLSIQDALKTVNHYFFPHIYHDSHLCMTMPATSPRMMNNVFWGSNFHNNWYTLYEQYRYPGDSVIKADAPEKYEEYQRSTHPPFDNADREFLASYKDFQYFEGNPLGIFISSNKKLIDDVGLTDTIDTQDYAGVITPYLVGFVFSGDGFCWVYLKDKTLLKFRPEQVKIL